MNELECKIGTQPELDIQLSQAISLKRIADALEKLTVVPTMRQLTPEQEAALVNEVRTTGFIMR